MIGIVWLAIVTLSLRTMKSMLSLLVAAPRNHDAGPNNPAA
jgi:hypothetical protein